MREPTTIIVKGGKKAKCVIIKMIMMNVFH